MSTPFLLAQISDMHIRVGPRADGLDPSASLRRILAMISEMGVDAIVATGDLVNDHQETEYAALAELLAAAPAPVFLTPGNHDDPDLVRRFFPDHARRGDARLSYAVEDWPVRLVSIDQTARGQTHGAFNDSDAAWLDATLAAAPAKPTIVAMHHPPFLTHDRLFDTIGLKGAELFASVIARHKQVMRIICGHHHRVVLGQVAQVPVFVAPSTAWAFTLALKPEQPVARKTEEKPGWALHVWTPQAGLATHLLTL